MATKKISELPLVNRVSGSQVAGGSVLPIVIGGGIQGTTNQISVEDFSLFVNAYNATTSSNTFIGTQNVTGDVNISGRLTVKEVVAQYETASILFSTGSTKLGDQLTDKHEFTGSTNITGSLIANGFITLNGQSLNNAFDRIHQATHSLQLATASIQAYTASADSRFLLLQQTTQSLQQATASLQQATASIQAYTASADSRFLLLQQTTQSLQVATASLQFHSASVNAQLLAIQQTTQSLQVATASLQFHSASVDAQLLAIQQTTQSLQVATASLNAFSASTNAHIVGISAFTSSQLAVNLGNSIYTASVDSHIVGISTYTSSVRDTLARVYQATESIQFQTASLLAFTASQDSRNFTLSQVTGSFRGEIGGLEAYSASLKAAAIVSSSTQVQNYDLFALNSNLYISTGSLIGITNGLMAFTASLDNTYATDAQLTQLYQATRSLELHSGSMVGVTNGLMALTASMKAQAIVSSSTQISNYYKFAETASANTTFYGGLTVTDYSKFGKSGVAKALDVFGGVSVTGSVITQQNTIGGFVGSYYLQWDSFGSQGGDAQASVGYFIGASNDDRKLRITSDRDIQLNHGNGVGRKIQIPRTGIGLGSVVELTGSLNITGSSTIVGDLIVTLGGITGSILATNGVLSGSVQIGELTQIAGIEAYTASLKGAAIVSSSQQITNYYKFAETSSANTFYGDQTITGSLYVNDVASTLQIIGNGFGQSSLISPNGALVLTPGLYGVQINGTYPDLQANGNITANGSVTGNIIATNNVVSSSVQITELAPLMAYTSSLKGQAIVSSSQQITNYYKFAETASANTFYGNQNISGSLTVNSTGASGISINSSNDNPTLNFTQLAQANSSARNWRFVSNYEAWGTIDLQVSNDHTTLPSTLTRVSITGGGDVNLKTGNLIFANGKGIDFSATANSGSSVTSELLNDYEAGTWTPTVEAVTGTYTTVINQRGTYTKIGRLVTVHFYFIVSTKGTGAGGFNITNLPYPVLPMSAGDAYIGSGINTSNSVTTNIQAIQGTTTCSGYRYDGTDSIIATNGNNGTVTYITYP